MHRNRTSQYSDPQIDRNGVQYMFVGIYCSIYVGVYIMQYDRLTEKMSLDVLFYPES